jgi:hypothetical protein
MKKQAFNGAAAVQRRKWLLRWLLAKRKEHASMGPQELCWALRSGA